MKTNLYSFILTLTLLLAQHHLSAQNNIDFTDKQIQGYTLFGLGFTTVAYTYYGYNDLDNKSNQRVIFYSIGTGLAITGVILLASGPKKKSKSNVWSGLSMSKTKPIHYDYKNYFYKK